MFKRIIVSSVALFSIVILAGCSNENEAEIEVDLENQEEVQAVDVEEKMKETDLSAIPEKGKGGEGMMMDSAEATEACSDKIENDECQFIVTNETGEEEEINGICKTPPARKDVEEVTEDVLSCMPEMKDRPERDAAIE